MTAFGDRRVLVTGSGGFVGSHLARGFARLGAQVLAVVRPEGSRDRLAVGKESLPGSLELCPIDLGDPRALAQVVEEREPALVVHAAVARRERSSAPASHLVRVNVEATVSLVEAAQRLRPPARLIILGSSLEYGPHPRPLDEGTDLSPTTFFGATKAASTLIAQQMAREHGLELAILRLFSVYGPGEAEHRLIPTAIRAALLGDELPMTPPGLRRDFIFIDDVVRACFLAATARLDPGEILNIGTGVQTTNEEAVALVAELAQKPIKVRTGAYVARRSDTAHWVAAPEQAQSRLGFRAETSLREGLHRTILWMRNQLAA